jgi:hypothetical protein
LAKNKIIKNQIMTILDLIKIDFNRFSENEFEVAYRGENTEGRDYIDYEKTIDPKVFDIFDKIQIKIFSDKFEISKNNFISVMLFASKGKAATVEIRNVIELLHKAFGIDSDGNSAWTNGDLLNLKIGIFSRIWDLSPNGKSIGDITEDSYSIMVGYKSRNMSTIYIEPECFSMAIWRINKILN